MVRDNCFPMALWDSSGCFLCARAGYAFTCIHAAVSCRFSPACLRVDCDAPYGGLREDAGVRYQCRQHDHPLAQGAGAATRRATTVSHP